MRAGSGRYLALLRPDPAEQLPEEPTVLSHLVAATMSLTLDDRQQLRSVREHVVSGAEVGHVLLDGRCGRQPSIVPVRRDLPTRLLEPGVNANVSGYSFRFSRHLA